MQCPFCEIARGETNRIIRESKHTFVVLSDPKLMDGHLLVISKRHVERFADLRPEERTELLEETIKLEEDVLGKIAPGCDVCQHYRPFIPDNGLKVTHLHVHVRPRFLDDELYIKVQKHENNVFQHTTDSEVEKYRKLLG